MMTHFLTCCLLFTTLVLPARAQMADAPVDVLDYSFQLELSDDTNEIIGEARITVEFLQDNVEVFHLDLIGKASPQAETGMTVFDVADNGYPPPYMHEGDRLAIRTDPAANKGDRRTYTIGYRGVPADGLIISQNKYGDRTFFGDNWPNRARHWLPTVDHPSDKATVAFLVVAPNHYQVVGSGRLVEESNLPDDLRLTHWRTEVPLATKVMVIGAARFAVQHVDEVESIPVESWVYPQDRDIGFFDYALAERILDFFDGHIGPFPYEKLANVQSKTRYGGMENASNIFYSENSVTGTRQSEGLLAHEIAHQWFGDSVTEQDWPHIWLSEGFATYFTQLYFEFTYGRDRMNAEMQNDRQLIVNFASQNPQTVVVPSDITDPNRLLNTYSYQKGGWILHMLRFVVGDAAFWDGIQAYYRQYRDTNANSADFQQVMEDAAGRNLDRFFQQWLYQPGQPHLEGGWRYDAAQQQLVITLNQTQPGDPFQVPLEVGIFTEDDALPHVEVLNVDRREHTFTIDLETPPTNVVLDPNTWLLMTADFQAQ